MTPEQGRAWLEIGCMATAWRLRELGLHAEADAMWEPAKRIDVLTQPYVQLAMELSGWPVDSFVEQLRRA